jgi:[acyl-carrier-protein] S-malonyltransferase
MFPGQSSATPDVLIRATQAHRSAVEVTEAAHRVLGPTRAAAYFHPDGAPLDSNRDVQVTVFLATQMYLAGLAAEGIRCDHSLGLSLGEYSHLVDIGALGLDDALCLVDERGRCFDEAPDGVMVTVLGVDHDTVAEVVEQAQGQGPLVISNYNAPTQHVIAGTRAAASWAASTLEDQHAAFTLIIEERVPMHSPLMADVARAFTPALERAPWRTPLRNYRPNVTGAPVDGAAASDFVSHLARHVSEPVRWRESVDAVVAANPDATFVEVGPGRVLQNMVSRAWRGTPCLRVDAVDEVAPGPYFTNTIEALRA